MQAAEFSAARILASLGGGRASAPVSLDWALARIVERLDGTPRSADRYGLFSQIAGIYGVDPGRDADELRSLQIITAALDGNPARCVNLELAMEEWARVADSYPGWIRVDHPIHYWRMNEPSGDFIDSVGLADAEANASLTRQGGVLTRGSNRYASFPGSAGVDGEAPAGSAPIGGNPRTIECWFASSNPAGQYGLWGYGNTAGSEAFNCRRVNEGNGGLYVYAWGNDSFVDFSGTVPNIGDGEPHHLVVTHNGVRALGLVIDGNPYNVTMDADLDTADSVFNIGNTIVGEVWAGLLGEMAVYDYVLPVARAQRHYEYGRRD